MSHAALDFCIADIRIVWNYHGDMVFGWLRWQRKAVGGCWRIFEAWRCVCQDSGGESREADAWHRICLVQGVGTHGLSWILNDNSATTMCLSCSNSGHHTLCPFRWLAHVQGWRAGVTYHDHPVPQKSHLSGHEKPLIGSWLRIGRGIQYMQLMATFNIDGTRLNMIEQFFNGVADDQYLSDTFDVHYFNSWDIWRNGQLGIKTYKNMIWGVQVTNQL